MGCYMCFKYRKYNKMHSSDTLPHEHGDRKGCIQSWQHEDVMSGIDDKMLSDFISKQAAEQRRAALKSSMAAEKRHEQKKEAAAQRREDGDDPATARQGDATARHMEHVEATKTHGTEHSNKSVKQVAQEFRAAADKAAQNVNAQKAEARRHCCVRLTVFIEKACCPRRKIVKKKKKLIIAAVGHGEEDEEDVDELDAAHDPYAEGLEDGSSSSEDSGGELTDYEKTMGREDKDSEADEQEAKERKEKEEREQKEAELEGIKVVPAHTTFADISFKLEHDLDPDTVYAKLRSIGGAIRRFRLSRFADRVVPKLRNSQVTGSTFRFIFNALNIHVPSEDDIEADSGRAGDTATTLVEATTDHEDDEDDYEEKSKVPPSLLWECRHFGGMIVVHSMLFTDEEEHHHGHWIAEDRFMCHVHESTFVARFTDDLVHTYVIPDSIDHRACMTCESNPRLEVTHEEHPYDHRDFFDFHGCETLQPVWEKAAAFYDHRMESKLKAAREAHNTGSSHSLKAGNAVRLHKDIRVDYVNMCSIETVTTEFRTPNREKVHVKGSAAAASPGKAAVEDEPSNDEFDSEEELEMQDAQHNPEEDHHKKKEETVDDHDEQAESESAASKSDSMSSSEGSHHEKGRVTQDMTEDELKAVGQSPEVLAAVAKARAAPLFQDLSEKHRSKAAKEHMGLNDGAGEGFFGGLADAFEDAIDGDDKTTPAGGGFWAMLTGAGASPDK